MSVRTIHLLLKLLAATAIVGAGVVLIESVVSPLSVSDEAAQTMQSLKTHPSARPVDLPPLQQFEAIFAKSLRGNSASPATAPVIASPAGLTLVGTVGDHIALLRVGGSEEVEAHAMGEKINGLELTAIRPGEVDLGSDNARITLRKPTEESLPEYIHAVPPPLSRKTSRW